MTFWKIHLAINSQMKTRPLHRPRERRNSSSWRRSSSVSRRCWNRAVPAIVAATAWNPRNSSGKLISRCRQVQTSLRMHPRQKRTRIVCRLETSKQFPAHLRPRTNTFSKRWVRHTSDGNLVDRSRYGLYTIWATKKIIWSTFSIASTVNRLRDPNSVSRIIRVAICLNNSTWGCISRNTKHTARSKVDIHDSSLMENVTRGINDIHVDCVVTCDPLCDNSRHAVHTSQCNK